MSGDVPDAEVTLAGDRIFVMLGPAEEENAVLRMCLAEARAMVEPLQAHNESLARQLLEGPTTRHAAVSEVLDSEQLYVEREALQCELEYALESQASYYLYREKSLLKELSMSVEQLGQLQIVLRAREKIAAQCNAQLDEEGARVEKEKLAVEQWKSEASAHLAAAQNWKHKAEHWKTAMNDGSARWKEEAQAWQQALEKKEFEIERFGKEVMRWKEEAQEWKLALKEKDEKEETRKDEAKARKDLDQWREEAQEWKQACEAIRVGEVDDQKLEKEVMLWKEEVSECTNAFEEKEIAARMEIAQLEHDVTQWKEKCIAGKAEWEEALEWKNSRDADAKKWQDQALKSKGEFSQLEHTMMENSRQWKKTEALLRAEVKILDEKGRADTDEWKNEIARLQRELDANQRRWDTRSIECGVKYKEKIDRECRDGEKGHNEQCGAFEYHNAQQVANLDVNSADTQEQLQHARTDFLGGKHCAHDSRAAAKENNDEKKLNATWENDKRALISAKSHVQEANNTLQEEPHSLEYKLRPTPNSCWREDAEKSQLDDTFRLLLPQKQGHAVASTAVVENSTRPPSPGHSVRSSGQYDVARIDLCRASLESKQLHSEMVSLKLELRASKEELEVKAKREVTLWDDLCAIRTALQAAEERAAKAESEYRRIRDAATFEGQIMTRGLEKAHTESIRFLRQSEEWRAEAAKYQTQIERLEAADRASIELHKQQHDAQLAEARLRELERQTEESIKRIQQELRNTWAKEKEDDVKEQDKWEEQRQALEATHKRELQAERERLQESHANELRAAESKWRTEMEAQCRTHDMEHRAELTAELKLQTNAAEANYQTKLDGLQQHIATMEATHRTKLEQYKIVNERADSNDARLALVQGELEAEKAKCSMLQIQCQQSELTIAQFREQYDRAAQKETSRVHELGDQLDQLRADLRNDLSLRASIEASTRWSKELEQQVVQLNAQQKQKEDDWKRVRKELENKIVRLTEKPRLEVEEQPSQKEQAEQEKVRVLREELEAEGRKRKAHERLRVQMEQTHSDALRHSIEKERRAAEDTVKKVKQSMTLQLNAERKKQERLRSSIVAERRQLRQFFKGEKDQVTYDKERVESAVRMSRSELTQANQVSMLLEDEKETALQELESWQQNVSNLTMHYASKTNAIPPRTPTDWDARTKKDPVVQPLLRELTLEVMLNTVLRLRCANMLRTAFDAWVNMKHTAAAHVEPDPGLNISIVSALDLPGWPKSPPKIPHRYARASGSSVGASRRSASEMGSCRPSPGPVAMSLRHSRHSFGDLCNLRASASECTVRFGSKS